MIVVGETGAVTESASFATGFERLAWHRLLFRLRCRETAHLPPFLGSTLRGAFGRALRWLSCSPRVKDCTTCPIRKRCAYLYIFETPIEPGTSPVPGINNAPHPFVIVPPAHHPGPWRPGEIMECELILVGKAIDHLPRIVLAFDWIADTGLGASRKRFELEEVWSVNPRGPKTLCLLKEKRRFQADPEPWSLEDLPGGVSKPQAIELRFVSPVQLKSKGAAVSAASFPALAKALFRRVAALAHFHSDLDLPIDFRDVSRRAWEAGTVWDEMERVVVPRYSSRQSRKIDQHGWVGSAAFFGSDLASFMPLVLLGEVFGVGKGASWGMGRYRWSALRVEPLHASETAFAVEGGR